MSVKLVGDMDGVYIYEIPGCIDVVDSVLVYGPYEKAVKEEEIRKIMEGELVVVPY